MTFDPTKPANGDSPALAPKQLRDNFSVIEEIVSKDHQWDDTPVTNSGKHNQARFPEQSSIPAGLAANEGTLYCKESASVSQIFYSPEDSGNEYQLTYTNTSQFSKFAQIATGNSGWTFLPGGIIFQFGTQSMTNGATITFPIAYGTLFGVQVSAVSGSKRIYCTVRSQTTASFVIQLTDKDKSSQTLTVNWQAIGVA